MLSGKRHLAWDLEHSADKSVDVIRPIVDEIDGRVRVLLGQLIGLQPRPIGKYSHRSEEGQSILYVGLTALSTHSPPPPPPQYPCKEDVVPACSKQPPRLFTGDRLSLRARPDESKSHGIRIHPQGVGDDLAGQPTGPGGPTNRGRNDAGSNEWRAGQLPERHRSRQANLCSRCFRATHAGTDRQLRLDRPRRLASSRRLPGYGMRSLVSDERQRARSCYAVLWTVSCLRGVPHYRAWRLVALRSLGLHARGGIVICEVNKDSRGKDPIGAVRRRHLVTMTRQSSYATVERISPDPLLAIYFPRL